MIKWPERDITLRAQQELVTQSGGVNVVTDLGFQIKINKYYSKNHNPTNCSSAHLFLHSLHDSLHDLSLWSLSPKNCHKHVKMTSLLPYKHIKRQKQTTRDFPIFYVLSSLILTQNKSSKSLYLPDYPDLPTSWQHHIRHLGFGFVDPVLSLTGFIYQDSNHLCRHQVYISL